MLRSPFIVIIIIISSSSSSNSSGGGGGCSSIFNSFLCYPWGWGVYYTVVNEGLENIMSLFNLGLPGPTA